MREFLTNHRARSLDKINGTRTVQMILDGKLPRAAYVHYLLDVYHYAQHSPRVISLAGSRCTSSHPALSQYLFRHAGEELGHEHWARSDLINLGVSEADILRSRPGRSCASMIGIEYYWAGIDNPVGLFGWMFTLEALGDDIGNLIGERVSKGLAAQKDVSHFLRGHGEADHDHAAELTAIISRYVINEKDKADVEYLARLSSDLYTGIVNEMLEAT